MSASQSGIAWKCKNIQASRGEGLCNLQILLLHLFCEKKGVGASWVETPAWHSQLQSGLSVELAGTPALMSVCLTMCLTNGPTDSTCLAEKMCIAAEGMKSNEVKWNIHRWRLIDGFIVREQMWPEKARVMMYCLTIYGSSMWIQTAAFISPHLYARECSSEWAQFGVSAATRRLMSPDMMYVLSSRSLSIIGHPQHG